jgi:formylmethanofuran dehydrogenase subunit E
VSISPRELEAVMDKWGTEGRVKEYVRRCVSFHSFAPPGLLIGVFMVDLAFEKLGAPQGSKVYAVAETRKCAPDAVQVITHATIGNSRLRIIETGKFAITLNEPSAVNSARGIRVYVDADKIRRYPTLNLWYTNDPDYVSVPNKDAIYDEILGAGRGILSWERVQVHVPQKPQWAAVMCTVCGEMVPDFLADNEICRTCLTGAYYEKFEGELAQ